jgi:hypothetical protein
VLRQRCGLEIISEILNSASPFVCAHPHTCLQVWTIYTGRNERIAGLAVIDPITSLPNASVSIIIIFLRLGL